MYAHINKAVLSPRESGLSAPGLTHLIVPWHQALAGYATGAWLHSPACITCANNIATHTITYTYHIVQNFGKCWRVKLENTFEW